ncbi:MAG: hypothetical protein ACPKPY_01790 [Nitrososphaeraceae archaeon]
MKYQISIIAVSALLILTTMTNALYAQDNNNTNQSPSTLTTDLINSKIVLANITEKPFSVYVKGIENATTISTEIGLNKTEGWYNDTIMINGIETMENGLYSGISQPDGKIIYSGNGTYIIKNNESEKATYIYQGIGVPKENGEFEERGVQIYSTNSTGELAFLDNLASIYLYKFDDTGQAISGYVWEWK